MAQRFVFVLLICLGFAFPAFSQSWDEMSSGVHSLRDAGPEFLVEVPVKKIAGARLVLFNERVARQLGLEIPADRAELEKMILEKFAYMVADSKREADPSKKWFATYYQDSNGRGKGEARGDGRALWSGELKFKSGGRLTTVDVALKGIGQTPLAWTNHSDPGHKDGMQSMREAVHSFIMSEINARNGLNTTIDLAVIELPFGKKDKYSGKIEKSAITIRVGEQMRLAHFRFWSDKPDKMLKLSNYTVKRVLGLDSSERVNAETREEYFNTLAKNLADEAARYFDLFAVHGSPTAGNRTVSGATIDLGTFRYLDGHHVGYTYLFDQLSLGGKNGQSEQLAQYILTVLDYFRNAGVRVVDGDSDAKWKEFREQEWTLFWKTYRERLTALWLARIGLDADAQKALTAETKTEIYNLLMSIHVAQTDLQIEIGDRKLRPAAYDPRKVMRGLLQLSQIADKNGRQNFAASLLDGRYQWKDDQAKAAVQTKLAGSLIAVAKTISQQVPDFQAKFPEFRLRADQLNRIVRPPMGSEWFEKYELPILSDIKNEKGTSAKWSEQALAASGALVDQGLLRNRRTNLGATERIGIFSGTFDSPHLGHRMLIQKAIETYELDRMYVIVNPSSDHKTGVSPFDIRLEMANAEFGDLPKVKIAGTDFISAFEAQDMEGVLNLVERKHPSAALYQIMGDDSFSRYLKAGAKTRSNLILVVNQRQQSAEPLPAFVGDVPVVNLPVEEHGYSSTLVREQVRKAGTSPLVRPQTLSIIRENSLFAPRAPMCGRVYLNAGGF